MSKPIITDVKKLIKEYGSGIAATVLAKQYNTSTNVITGTLKRNGVTLRSISEAKIGKPSPLKGYGHTAAAKRNMSENHADFCGENHPNFKGSGRWSDDGVWLRRTNRGYLRRNCPDHPLACKDGSIGEHRYQACLKYGVEAVRGKDVHHIDRNKENNSWDNLIPLTAADHKRMEDNFAVWRKKQKRQKR